MPTQAGTFNNISLVLRDKAGATVNASYSLTVTPASSLTLSPAISSAGVAGQNFSQVIGATGGYGQYTFSSSNLPAWLSLSSMGVLSGTTTVAGTYSFSVKATDNALASLSGTQSYTLTVNPAAPKAVVVSTSASTVVAGKLFNVTITANDIYGNACRGPVTLTSSDGQPVNVSSGSLTMVNGAATVAVTLNRANTTSLRATVGGVTGASSVITVNPGAVASVSVITPSAVSAGTAFNVSVTAKDALGNGCPGTATLTNSDGQSWTVALANDGSGAATVTLTKAQTVTFTATVGGLASQMSNIAVRPAAPASLSISTIPTSMMVRDAAPVTITVRDVYGNLCTSTSVGVISSNNSYLSVSSTTVQTNSNGQASVTLSAVHSGDATISITAGSLRWTSGAVHINPNPLDDVTLVKESSPDQTTHFDYLVNTGSRNLVVTVHVRMVEGVTTNEWDYTYSLAPGEKKFVGSDYVRLGGVPTLIIQNWYRTITSARYQ